ncbi:MAG: hypothetical protein WAP51_00775 [Candidatus Sungiibacteriota bacterium]
MAQERKRARRKKEEATEAPAVSKKGSARKKELDEKVAALLEEIETLIREHRKDSCPKKMHTPHVHLCDGTKMDLRKMFK